MKIAKLKFLTSLFILLGAALLGLVWADHSAAHPPHQGEQPAFTVTGQTADDGSVTIQSQETRLDGAYFAATGERTGLTVTAAGLTLADGATAGTYTSGVIETPLGFTTDAVMLWGAELPADSTLRLETRLSLDRGISWSEWVENPEAFYPVRDDLHSGPLIWVGSETALLQFKASLTRSPDASPTLKHVVVVFSDTSQGPTDGEIASQMAEVQSGQTCPITKPPVVSRKAWGCPDGQFSPRRPPVYQPVTHIILHHSVTPNTPRPYQNYAGWVRSVWNYHAKVLWWGDVGYNYLIDPNGVIYEGRAGGDDVIGIHDGHNRGSMAIGFLGCYGNCHSYYIQPTEPSPAMLNSATQLIGWKLAQKRIDPLSSGPYAGKSNVPVIAGGRDVSATDSPGDNLYNKLPQLRSRVADNLTTCRLQACRITGVIFGRDRYNVGDTVEFTVKLADFQGLPLPGAVVTATRLISPTALNTQAATGFGFVDRAGEYDGRDADTRAPGLYAYIFTANDPAGQRFLPCTATASVSVLSQTTPTVTPTSTSPPPTATPILTGTPPTATPTLTPTATPTPTATTPAGTVLRPKPSTLVIPACSTQGTAEVEVVNVSNLFAVELRLRYDPAIAQVIDADPGREGVQIRRGDAFANGFIAQNKVDTTNGLISFAAVLFGGSAINGQASLISVDFQPVANGNAVLTLEQSLLADTAGRPLPFTPQNGQLQVTPCGGVTGQVALQGRSDHSGVSVSDTAGQQTQTQADGSFSLTGGDSLTFNFPGYLSAQGKVQVGLEPSQSGADTPSTVSLGTITLLAGDVNTDNVIDILDLASLATHYLSNDPTTDLNGDGVVDILDLALAAQNYQQQGPLTNWQ